VEHEEEDEKCKVCGSKEWELLECEKVRFGLSLLPFLSQFSFVWKTWRIELMEDDAAQCEGAYHLGCVGLTAIPDGASAFSLLLFLSFLSSRTLSEQY
jgi:hypothetical protein